MIDEANLLAIQGFVHLHFKCSVAQADLLIAEVRRLRAALEELRQELRDYGQHDAGCPRAAQAFHGSLSAGVLHERGGGGDCTCGLEALLEKGDD